jgi:hypothetical protein
VNFTGRPYRGHPEYAWCEDYREVTAFGRHLAESGVEAEDLQRYYEKPWNWTSEREALMAEVTP